MNPAFACCAWARFWGQKDIYHVLTPLFPNAITRIILKKPKTDSSKSKRKATINRQLRKIVASGTPGQTLTGGLPLRRRSLYTTELQGHIHIIFIYNSAGPFPVHPAATALSHTAIRTKKHFFARRHLNSHQSPAPLQPRKPRSAASCQLNSNLIICAAYLLHNSPFPGTNIK